MDKPLKPEWLKIKVPFGPEYARTRAVLASGGLHTICREGACPNRSECWNAKTASFLILGSICTRNCRFCNVSKNRNPDPVSPGEPEKLAEAVSCLGLKHVVITSVTRDDLPDGGALHFRRCIEAVRRRTPGTKVEILTPDFRNKPSALEVFQPARPDVFGHNIETVPRLYSSVRAAADYGCSLGLLEAFKKAFPEIPVKSGLMLGLGEREAEVRQVMADLRAAGTDLLTVGQYLRPSAEHFSVVRYVPPEEFDGYREEGLKMGFKAVVSGPFVRSSYRAAEVSAG